MIILQTKSGEVRLHDDKIIIDDISASQNATWFKAFPFAFLIFSFYMFNQAINSKDDSDLFLSFLSAVLLLLTFINFKGFDFKRINDKEIMIVDIETVKFNKMMWNVSAVIQLKNAKRRRIYNIKKTELAVFEKFFVENNIKIM